MDAEMLTSWMQEEHRAVNEIMARLRERLTVPKAEDRKRWITEARERFEHLRAHMTKHIAMEEEGGYMQPVLRIRPGLYPQVERLHHEHRELMEIMNSIHQALQAVGPEDCLLIADTCSRMENLLSYLGHHEDRENLLVTSVFTFDIGDSQQGG